jgi:hypothetical protein
MIESHVKADGHMLCNQGYGKKGKFGVSFLLTAVGYFRVAF